MSVSNRRLAIIEGAATMEKEAVLPKNVAESVFNAYSYATKAEETIRLLLRAGGH